MRHLQDWVSREENPLLVRGMAVLHDAAAPFISHLRELAGSVWKDRWGSVGTGAPPWSGAVLPPGRRTLTVPFGRAAVLAGGIPVCPGEPVKVWPDMPVRLAAVAAPCQLISTEP